MIFGIIGVVLVAIIGFFVSTYNGLVVARNKANTWDEYLKAQDKKYYETEFYTSVLAELLDDAIIEFEKAMQLVKICNEKLNTAEESIAKIVEDNGELIEFNINE